MKDSQKGFVPIIILIAVTIIVIGGGAYVYTHNMVGITPNVPIVTTSQSTTTTTVIASTTQNKNSKNVYSSKELGFSITYPPGVTFKEEVVPIGQQTENMTDDFNSRVYFRFGSDDLPKASIENAGISFTRTIFCDVNKKANTPVSGVNSLYKNVFNYSFDGNTGLVNTTDEYLFYIDSYNCYFVTLSTSGSMSNAQTAYEEDVKKFAESNNDLIFGVFLKILKTFKVQ